MKKSIIYYVLGVVSAVIAVIIFIKSFDWRSLLILIFGVAAAILFMQGKVESNKKG
jgi:drug/metabolite transporter (DMT)-like permease